LVVVTPCRRSRNIYSAKSLWKKESKLSRGALAYYSVRRKLAPYSPAEGDALFHRKPSEANPGAVNFVADIQADQERGQRFDDSCVLELAAVQGARAWDFAD